jgi:hypothetical protein
MKATLSDDSECSSSNEEEQVINICFSKLKVKMRYIILMMGFNILTPDLVYYNHYTLLHLI